MVLKKWVKIVLFLLAAFVCSYIIFLTFNKAEEVELVKNAYIKSEEEAVLLYNVDFSNSITLTRGAKVTTNGKTIVNETTNKEYVEITYEDNKYLVFPLNLTYNEREVVGEKHLYIRTPVSVYQTLDTAHLISFIKKGEKVEVLDYDYLKEDGTVNKYKVKYNEIEGYIYAKYTVKTQAEALENYDSDGAYLTHASRKNYQGGGSAANLDYFPVEKPKFENNVMPTEVRSLYLNSGVIYNVDKYIELAKKSNINAFVVDIKDNTAPAYKSEVMQKYSPTNYEKAFSSIEKYKEAINKLKENGFYVIGRITVFKDNYYAKDHPEDTIMDTRTNASFLHNGSYWPSAYSRDVWEFNVELAKEAVLLMGFNEIQFDYVRFPDRTSSVESYLNYQNIYNEEKAQAIQNFLFYACDEIHSVGAYVSADVFGESAHNYVSGYGQYWGAISNVVDVISGMPYPELFNKYEYGFTEPVWTVPYDLLYFWGKNYVAKQQNLIPTPAIVRTWIQAYDITWRNPKTSYDAAMVSEEISGLYDAGLTGGYITWNAGSSLTKYEQLSPAFNKNYLGSD
ncbi:MAG: hypothetical protein E7165_01320 [Firmicutes bacterium]|nr:hypothetical protein [Bacillota bacterium]